jgi:hypothetical protein
MGFPDQNQISIICDFGGYHSIIMEGSQFVSRRDAEVSNSTRPLRGLDVQLRISGLTVATSQVLLLGPFETPNADDS